MKALLFVHPGQLTLVERPIPQPQAGQVLLRVGAAGICMTDVHIFHGHFSVQVPRVLGHELAGTVVALGAQVDPTWLGQRVGVQPARFCGECAACRRGLPELCANFQCLGNTHDGGYAEYALVSAAQLVALGDIPTETGVWLEPLACVLHALSRVSLAHSPVLIAGAGTFGQLFTQVLTQIHQIPVGIVDPNPTRLDRALEMGAVAGWRVTRQPEPTPRVDEQIMTWSGGGPALLIDTTGQATSIERLLRWAAPGATILLFGVSAPDLQIPLAPASIFSRELCLTAAAGMTPTAFDAALGILRAGRLSLESLIVARVGLAEVPPLFTGMPSGKIIINPLEGAG